MSNAVWYRSLYWRIAIGFVALLAALLVIQAGVFLWLTVVVGRSSLGPAQLAAEVSGEIGAALERDPSLDINEHLRDRFGRIYQPFLVVMHDGRTASNRADYLPPGFGRSLAFARSRRMAESGSGARPPDPEAPPQRSDPRIAGRGGGPGRSRVEISPIHVGSVEVGVVGVPGNPPPTSMVLAQFGPTLALAAVVLLVTGSAVMALLIFRPAHNRLRMLEQAATALGEGRTDVRAAESGGDEVTSLARTFNRMADDLSAREAALIASDQARRQLLADVSHELMTPLAAIRGYTETLAMPDLKLDSDTRLRYLNIVGHETEKLEALIGDLLDLARLEGGGGTLNVERVAARDLFTRLTDRHGPAIRDRRIDVSISIEPPDLLIEGDANRIEQALQNLAANALRHTPEAGRLVLSAHKRGDSVVLAVRDSGPGVPLEHLPHIFDRFYKADASRTAGATPTRSGLGLSIVRAIAERHHGTVTAANSPEGGAIFEIVLPARAERV
jgi:signal transduction histidine kinase